MSRATSKSGDFARKLVSWQVRHGRHGLPWQGTTDPYRIWVSEIMLQQTQVAAVVGYFEGFMQRFPDVKSLADAPEDEVLRLWSGLGYYARARNLHKAARMILENYGGSFPCTAEAIGELPGVGRSTAAAIAAFAFGERGAILDGNVKRVLARHFGIDGFPGSAKVEALLWSLACDLLPSKDIEVYTQGLMDLGATVCVRSKPQCEACPVSQECVALHTDRVRELPSPRPKKDHPTRQATWLVLRHGGEVLLQRRPSAGIWGGLWSFPEFDGRDLAQDCLSRFGCVIAGHREMPSFAHGFTHFRLEISPLICDVRKLEPRMASPESLWLNPEAAISAAVPTPVRNLLRRL